MMAIFTLEEARMLLPQVRDITQHYYDLVEEQREALVDPNDTAEVARVEQRMNELLQEWVSAINALGVDVKGCGWRILTRVMVIISVGS